MKQVKLEQKYNGAKVFINGQEIINATEHRDSWSYGNAFLEPQVCGNKKCARLIVFWDDTLVEFEAWLSRNNNNAIICDMITNDTV